MDWANTVKSSLAPVSYQLTTLSVLFNFINGLDAAGAIKSYNNYLNTYCLRILCPPIIPDRPEPKPLVINFIKLPEISGPDKNPHTYDTNDGQIKVAMRVRKILIGSDSVIDSI